MVNGSKCKPVDSGECARRLGKRTTEIQYFDMELQFDTGKHSASLRFLRGEKGLLEVQHESCAQPFKKRIPPT